MAKDTTAPAAPAELTTEEYRAIVSQLEAQLAESEGLIAELQAELAKKETNTLTPNAYPTLKHRGKVYEVHAKKFQFEGKIYEVTDLEDKELVGRLIEKSAGFLIPVA